MSAGSYSRSASCTITTTRPRTSAKPERSAAPLPWLRSCRTSSTSARGRATIAAVPSLRAVVDDDDLDVVGQLAQALEHLRDGAAPRRRPGPRRQVGLRRTHEAPSSRRRRPCRATSRRRSARGVRTRMRRSSASEGARRTRRRARCARPRAATRGRGSAPSRSRRAAPRGAAAGARRTARPGSAASGAGPTRLMSPRRMLTELGQLVERRAPQQVADARDARVATFTAMPALGSCSASTTIVRSLRIWKRAPVAADALLAEQHRPAVLELDRAPPRPRARARRRQADGRADHVEARA